MLGAFAAYFLLLYAGLGYWWAIIIAPIVVGITGIIIERLFLQWLYKLDHLYGLLLTFGLALIFEGTFRNFFGSSGLPYSVPPTLQGGQKSRVHVPAQLPRLGRGIFTRRVPHHLVRDRAHEARLLSARRDREPDARTRLRINVPRMITLTYGFGVALAALAGVMAAPIYNVSPRWARISSSWCSPCVVIGGMGSIMGAIVTGSVWASSRASPRSSFRGIEHGDLHHHGDRAVIRPAGLFGRAHSVQARCAGDRGPRRARAQRGDCIRRYGLRARYRADVAFPYS